MPSAVGEVLGELHACLDGITDEDYAAVVDLVRTARGSVLVSGQGRSGLVAQMVAMRLMHLGLAAHAVGEPTAPPVRTGDVLIVVSGSGETPTSTAFATLARDEGATVVAVTRGSTNRLARIADRCLAVAPVPSSQFAGSLFEQAALVLLDAVVLDVSGRDADTYRQMMRRHTNLQ